MDIALVVNRSAFRVNEQRIEEVKRYLGNKIAVFYSTINESGLHIGDFDPAEFQRIGVMGGDGTLNGIVNYLIGQPFIPEIFWIPAGTGNGYSAALHLPKSTAECVKLAFEGEAKPVDVIHVTKPFGRYVLNIFDAGFMAHALKMKNDIGKGMSSHTIGAFAALPDFSQFVLEYCKIGEEEIAIDKISCIAAGKGFTPSVLPVLEVLPKRLLDDGELRVAIYEQDAPNLILAGLKMLGGGIVSRREYFGTALEFRCGPTDAQYDGHYAGFFPDTTTYKMQVEPGKIKLIMPKKD